MNVIDRAIAAFSPSLAVRREAARMALRHLTGGTYDGAVIGRRAGAWFASQGDANAVINGPLPRLRARARDVVRNTWWGARIKATVTTHAVGSGVTPLFATGDKELNRRAADAWHAWRRHCDARGQLDLNGQFALACDSIVEAGEVLVQMLPSRDLYRRGLVPLELRLLEPDHIDASRDGRAGERVIDAGIEYAPSGRRLAYWIYPEHPGSAHALRLQSERIASSDMLHVYRIDRIGQGRGVPWVAPVLLKGRDVADLEEAVVVKSRVEACLAAFVSQNGASSRTLSDQVSLQTRQSGSRRIEQLSPAAVIYGEPGESVTTITPSGSMAFESVLMSAWMCLAAGAGITYDQLTGDMRQANYSSLRAGKIEFRAFIERFQWLTLAQMLLDPVTDRWAQWAQDFGILPRRPGGYPREWMFPAWQPIDPIKDMQADILAVRAGRLTWDQFVAAWGFDPDTQLDSIANWMQALDERKVVLDTDPRRAMRSPKATASKAASSENAAAGKEDDE